MSEVNTIRVGGACGFWGDSSAGLTRFLESGTVDYIIFDYLAEITMSILARARQTDPVLGYATDFVSDVLAPNLETIARDGVKIIANAGGVNPEACAQAIRRLISDAGHALKVACVTGDDITVRLKQENTVHGVEMFSGAPFPPRDTIVSANAYLGGFPIAEALATGADIVITGRCADSALVLGPCIHAFGWTRSDLAKLAGGSLAGHILECGPQATGGNFTDWKIVRDALEAIAYPIAEIWPDGSFECSKPPDTGGLVSVGTVAEQMLYEIGDPQAYILPDVICDFSEVRLEQAGTDVVRVTGARGRPAPATYKVCATWMDGWRAGAVWFYYGEDAPGRARAFADAGIARARARLRSRAMADYSDVLVEIIGDESQYGACRQILTSREVAVKIACRHEEEAACRLFLREVTGAGLAAPPGLCAFAGARSKPSPVVRLFSFELPKSEVRIRIESGSGTSDFNTESGQPVDVMALQRPDPPRVAPAGSDTLICVPLEKLAFCRSGDKGDMANVGVIPRHADFAAWIWRSLTEEAVAKRFSHFVCGPTKRFFMPGTGAVNFLFYEALGGGGIASLRNDPQAKGFSQILLQAEIEIPVSLSKRHFS